MSQLAEYLNTVGREIYRGVEKNSAILEEWKDAAVEFLAFVREAVHRADPDGLLQIRETTTTLREQRLGLYTLPSLEIRLGLSLVTISPRARFNIGKVELGSGENPRQIEGRFILTDGGNSYSAVREVNAGRSVWYISKTDIGNPYSLLDETTLQNTLLDLLK